MGMIWLEISDKRCTPLALDDKMQHSKLGVSFTATTRSIKVSVNATWLPRESDPSQNRYFWRYDIEITNEGGETVQLMTRHWIIIDGHGHRKEVRGDGVIGEQPKLLPGATFSYASGTPLATDTGFMQGTYHMITDTGEGFDVEIPAFSLDSPYQDRRVN